MTSDKEKKYLHKLSLQEYRKLAQSGLTFGELNEQFKKPDWCGHQKALIGDDGCYALVMSFEIEEIKDCFRCEFFIH